MEPLIIRRLEQLLWLLCVLGSLGLGYLMGSLAGRLTCVGSL